MTYARSSSAVSDGTLASRPRRLLGNPSPRDSLQDHILAILAVGVVAANEGARPRTVAHFAAAVGSADVLAGVRPGTARWQWAPRPSGPSRWYCMPSRSSG